MASPQWFSVISFLVLVMMMGPCYCQQSSSLPVRINTTVITTENNDCPTPEIFNDQLGVIRNEVRGILDNTVIPYLSCPCGGSGEWTKIANLDMTDPNQQCPSNWRLNIFSDIRGCGGETSGASHSAFFSSNGRTYSRVCGKIIAYQKGSPDALRSAVDFNVGLEGTYLDGISLTHGAQGSRSHIWTFIAALYDSPSAPALHICPCTNSNSWPFTIPSFIGDNYFCDTGDHDDGVTAGMYYPDDPLFDGQGCGPDSTCCQFNIPPWFCTELPQLTSDDLEIRIIGNSGIGDEDTIISLIDIYIR